METKRFDVKGMTCSACSTHIEKSVAKQAGVLSVHVQLLTNTMTVVFDDSITQPEHIESVVEASGYEAQVQGAQTSPKNRINDEETDALKIRFWGSLVFLLPLMLVTMGPMVGLSLFEMKGGSLTPMTLALLQFILVLPVLYLNRAFFSGGFRSLFNGAPNMDTLVAMGSSAALFYGIAVLFQLSAGSVTHQGAHAEIPLYFESAATILTLVTLGKYLEALSKRKTTDAIRGLLELTPDTALLLQNGIEIQVPIDLVKVGDAVVLKPGQRAPVDGTVVEGRSTMYEAMLTGESMPVEKSEGARILSASVNQSGYLVYKATRVGSDTTLAQMIQLVEEASTSKAPISRMADRISSWFVPVVLILALLVTLVWLFLGQPFSWALSIGISILVISCPCALGLATPVAIMVGTGKGASLGLLFKSGEALETTRDIDTIVLDKTGTLTVGKPVLTDLFTNEGVDENQLLLVAATLEQYSEHPLAKIVVDEAVRRNLSLGAIDQFTAVPGRGIQGTFQGNLVWVGNAAHLKEQGLDFPIMESKALLLAKEGKTPLFVAQSNQILGVLAVSDVLKADSFEAVRLMQAKGLEVIMLTGDRKEVAEVFSAQLGIQSVYADVLPTDKEAVIKSLQAAGKKVMMVGDGINDAPALARAEVGVAIGAGADIAVESADVVLTRNNLMDVLSAISLSRAVLRNIRQNLFWAFFYNVMAIPLAAGAFYYWFGWTLSPMIAAAAMSVSSVTVVLNALRLKRFKGIPTAQEGHADSLNMNKTINSIPMKTKVLQIEGMTCMHCVGRVQKALNELEGVEAKVDLDTKNATVSIAGEVTDTELKNAVEDAGYEVTNIS